MVLGHDKTARMVWASLLAIWLSGCAMTSHAETFRFEDYRDDQSLREALLRLHPPGSPVEAARETLERAGAKCQPVIAQNANNPPVVFGYDCLYSYTIGFVITDLEVSAISNQNGQVINFASHRELTGL